MRIKAGCPATLRFSLIKESRDSAISHPLRLCKGQLEQTARRANSWVAWRFCFLIILMIIMTLPGSAQRHANPGTPPFLDDPSVSHENGTDKMSAKQRATLIKANFEKSKKDAAELAALAKDLRQELSKPDVNLLAYEIINRADKIEKLARKIRDETKAH